MPEPAQQPSGGGVQIPQNTPISLSSQQPASDAGAAAGLGVAAPNPSTGTVSSDQMAQDTATALNSIAELDKEIQQADTQTAAPAAPTGAPVQATSPESAAATPAAPAPAFNNAGAIIQPRTDKNYNNIVEVLVDDGALEQDLANKLQTDQITTGKRIEDLVAETNVVTEEAVTKAKATFNKIPFVKLNEVGVYPEALNQLPEGAARHYAMLPFAYDKANGTLSVAMKDPLDLSAIDFAQQKTGLRIVAHYATPSEVDNKVAEYYSQTLSSEVTAALEQTSQIAEAQNRKKDFSKLSKQTIRQAPITKIVETLLSFAIKARASDIHIEPLEDRTRVRYRIDGILSEKLILPKSVHDAVVSRIKILSGLKIDEKRVPQDGRFNFALLEQEVDLRVSTLPTINGEKIVMRLLKKDQNVPTLPELGLNGMSLHNVEAAAKVPHGIVLVTGPTGSGKTTTLYSLLHKINTPRVNIMTLEDPVEYQMAGVNQVQINPQAGLTFASGLRSFLRQDPNIIMVGEIRDSETAELAIQAALTGHLVFSTLHTSSAAGALPRLMDMGAEPFLLASSMTLVIAQRVLRKINVEYKEEYKPEPAVLKDIQEVLGDKLQPWLKKNNKTLDSIMLSRPKKDKPETEPDFKGRVAIFEVMKISEPISKMILERKPASDMEKLALQEGMLLMKQDGYMKVLEGVTTIEEVLRVAQI